MQLEVVIVAVGLAALNDGASQRHRPAARIDVVRPRLVEPAPDARACERAPPTDRHQHLPPQTLRVLDAEAFGLDALRLRLGARAVRLGGPCIGLRLRSKFGRSAVRGAPRVRLE